MRNYWLRIALGALGIFAVGMIGVSLVRQGAGRVRTVVAGSGPISFPLAFVPFKLEGEKLGSVDRVILERDAPKRVSAVRIEVKLRDSVVARGLEGCRLAANFDEKSDRRGIQVNGRGFSKGVFFCLHGDTTSGFQEFGRAVFQPGGVTVPLLLPNDIVDDLKQGDLGSEDADSAGEAAEARADSIADAVEARADSISAIAEARADSIMARNERLVDSLRREGSRRADSARRVADSVRKR
jgi:hypothetical protein